MSLISAPSQDSLLGYARRVSLHQSYEFAGFRKDILASEGGNEIMALLTSAIAEDEVVLIPYYLQQMRSVDSSEHRSVVRAFAIGNADFEVVLSAALTSSGEFQSLAAGLSMRRDALRAWLKTLQKDGFPMIDFTTGSHVESDFGSRDKSGTVFALTDHVQQRWSAVNVASVPILFPIARSFDSFIR